MCRHLLEDFLIGRGGPYAKDGDFLPFETLPILFEKGDAGNAGGVKPAAQHNHIAGRQVIRRGFFGLDLWESRFV